MPLSRIEPLRPTSPTPSYQASQPERLPAHSTTGTTSSRPHSPNPNSTTQHSQPHNRQRQLPAPQPTGSITTTTATPSSPPSLILRLRGQPTQTQERRHIAWSNTVIDNEHLNRKKSKVCCIYHKTRLMGESSSEEDSSDSSSSGQDSDSDIPDGAQPSHSQKRQTGHAHGGHGHDHGKSYDGCGHSDGHKARRKPGKPGPNAYEKMPRVSSRPRE